MECLSITCPVYGREYPDGYIQMYQWDEVHYDEYSGEYYSGGHGGGTLKWQHDRPAEWWCVAVYTSDRAYGGPEEGGWWYSCGELVEHHRIKFFDDYTKAYEYSQELWNWCFDQNKDRGDVKLVVRGFTEQMPDTYYPKKKPFYC